MLKTLQRLKNAATFKETAAPLSVFIKKPSKFRPIHDLDNVEDEKPEFTPFVVKKHPTVYYQDLCKRLASEGKIAEAVAVVEKRMVEDRVKPEKFNYITVIHILAKAGQARKAMEFFRKMRAAGHEPGPHTVTSLMNACANAAPEDAKFAVEQTSWLYNRIRHLYGIPNTPAIYFAAMKCYAKHGDIKGVFRLADQMIEDGWYAGTRIFAYLLSAAVADKEAGFQLALKVWESMKTLKRKPTLFHYQLLIRACRECGLGEKGNALLKAIGQSRRKALLNQISQNKLTENCQNLIESDPKRCQILDLGAPESEKTAETMEKIENSHTKNALTRTDNVLSLTATMEPQIKLGLLGGMDGFLDQMKKDQIEPDLKFCSSFLYLIPSNVESESKLIDYAAKNRIKLDLEFFNLLIYRRASRNDKEGALACLDEIRKLRLQPDQRTFAALALSCRKNDDGLILLRDMKNLNMKPALLVFKNLINQALKRNQFLYARNLLSQMLKFGTEPNEQFLILIEDNLARAREILVKQKLKSTENDQKMDIIGYQEFLTYYESWLEKVNVLRTIDPRLTLLNKKVNTDDLREDWEKPWVAEEKVKGQKEALGNVEIVP